MSYGYRQPQQVAVAGLWLQTFTATLAAVVLGGFILIVGTKLYIENRIESAVKKFDK